MAETGNNGINFMALLNPQFAAQQQKFALQQAMAQQMMEQGSQQEPTAQLANPGGQVIQNSPWLALSRGVEKGLGAYQAQKAIGDQMAAIQNMGVSNQPQDPNGMTPTELLHDMMARGSGTAEFNNRMAGQKATAEAIAKTINTPIMSPEGLPYYPKPPAGALPAQQPNVIQPTPPVTSVNLPLPKAPLAQSPVATAANPSPMSPQGNGGPVVLSGANDTSMQIPIAGDGKPLLPNMDNIPSPNPQNIPDYKTPATNSGVNLNKQLTDGDIKTNGAFATESQSLAQEKSRIQNLINTYQQVQSGSLTAQDPEFFQKLAAAGITDSPEQLKSLAGIQTATQNHILQIIGQIKDTNASLDGGAATRTFGSVVNALLDRGESVKDQPEALWNIITQAQGQVDHHLDMMNAYQKVGGMGNRLNGGATMPADTFATKFTLAHPIDAYIANAQKQVAPFKGMAGNAGQNRISIIDPNGNPGTIDKAHLQSLLDAGGKLAQ